MRQLGLVGALAVVALAGCYGSTEPATDVGSESATLRAYGTADKGQAQSWFEYEVAGRVGGPQQTSQLNWPAGARGPIIQKVSDLSAGTPYTFRICGSDDQTPPVCAQTKTFTTKPPAEDSVHAGWWFGCCNSFGVNARSGPGGENPTGSMGLRTGSSFDPVSRSFGGTVTCLEVDGRRAVIGAVGQVTTSPPGTSSPATLLAMVEDGVTAVDKYDVNEIVSGSTPPDCSTAQFDSPSDISEFEFVVNDAP
jgi:hypothetical protein